MQVMLDFIAFLLQISSVGGDVKGQGDEKADDKGVGVRSNQRLFCHDLPIVQLLYLPINKAD